jgi:hypothetical protein
MSNVISTDRCLGFLGFIKAFVQMLPNSSDALHCMPVDVFRGQFENQKNPYRYHTIPSRVSNP